MAGNRDIHGEVVLDVQVDGEEKARERLREAFAKLDATVNVNADFDRAQVQAAMDKVAGKGIKVAVNAAFTLTQMRAAAREAAARGKGIHVNVNAKFSKVQIQRELLASSAGVKIPVLVQAIQDGTTPGGGRGISEKLAREYRLAAQAAASDPGAAQAAVRGVNQRIGAFQAASLRMKEITAKSEADRLVVHEKTNAAIKLDDIKAMRETERRQDKLVDERRKDAQQITKITHTANEKIRVSNKQIANEAVSLQNQVVAAMDKGLISVQTTAEKENEKRTTRRVNNESDAAKAIVINEERGNQARLTNRDRVLGRLEIREDAHEKRLIEQSQAAALRRQNIEAQFRARMEAADRAFEQRRVLASERAQRAMEARNNVPIIQRVLLNTDKINSSLTEFDRSVTRVLRTTLAAFGIWSAGVTAAVTGAAIAGAVAFGRMEEAGVRAGAVVASQVRADEFLDRGKAISNYAAVTDDARQKITANAQAIALATTGFAPTEVIEGTRALLQAGQEMPEALVNIGAAARFAQVNELELADASDRLAAGLAAAGKGAEYSNKLLDQISFTAQSALGNAGDYLEAFANRGASSFRTYGEGIEETLTLLALLGQTGVTGRTAGTQASIVIRDIAKAAAKSPEAFEAYGVAVKSATTPNVTFNETLVSLAAAIEKAQKGNRIAALRKELGFMDKSFGSILQIIPQVNELGATGLDNFAKGLGTSAGSVNRQVEEINKTLPAQFDKVGDAINIALGKLGERYGDELTDIFNELSGPGGLIPDATGVLLEFGDEVAEVLERVLAYIRTDEFIAGMRTMREAVAVTVEGVADSFAAFSRAFGEGEDAKTTFEAIADAILAFSRVSAATLPVVAEILGKIFDTLIDNADAFETFAKLALGVYAVRKAYALLIKPVGSATLALIASQSALQAVSATSNSGALLTGLAAVAERFKFIRREATAAAIAVNVGQTSAFGSGLFATGGGIRSKGAVGLGVTGAAAAAQARMGNTLAGFGQASKLGRGGTAAGDTARVGAQFDTITTKAPKTLSLLEKISKVLGRVASGFAKFAGPLALVALAIEAAIGIFRGFFDELERGGKNGEFKKSMAELEPIFNAIWETAKVVFEVVMDILGVVGRVGESVGAFLGGVLNDVVVAMGDIVRGVKALFEGDLIEALKAFGDVFLNLFINTLTAPIAFVIDLVADLLGSFEGIPIIGDKIEGVSNAIEGAADHVRDFQVNMSGASSATDDAKASVDGLSSALQYATTTAAGLAFNQRIVKNIADLTAEAQRRATAAARGSVVQIGSVANAEARANGQARTLLTTINTFHPTFASASTAGVNALGRIEMAAQSTTSQLLAMQSALQAGLGQTANAQESFIQSQLVQQLANAQQSGDQDAIQRAKAEMAANTERLRRERLIREARRARRDQKIIDDALGTGGPVPVIPGAVDPAAGTGSAAQPLQRTFLDPDDAIQAAIDRLRPTAKIAEVNALVTKFTTDATASTERARAATNKFTGDAARGYQLTRRDTLLLAEAMPRLDAALEAQRGKVAKLEEALTSLQQVQLKGSRAFSDAAFENDQAVKRLQLQRLDLLAAGNTETSTPITDIDKQIADLQKQAERASLVESLELDPLRRKLEQTFNPVNEDTFENIIARFDRLSLAQQTQTDKLTAQELVHTRLNAALTAAQTRYEKIDAAAAKSVEAFNAAQQAAAGTAASLSSVGDSATAGAKAVKNYSGAVEKVPSGKGVVDKSLKGINERVAALVPQFQGAGAKVMTNFVWGVNQTNQNVMRPAWVRIVGEIKPYLDTGAIFAERAGEGVMQGFFRGLVHGFGHIDMRKDSPAWFMHVYIPEWIKANKGPVAYDATILVPAGHAVMEGFGRGLRDGFGQIQNFVKDVGPSLKEYISADEFGSLTADAMLQVGVDSSKVPNIEEIFGHLRETLAVGAYPGMVDPALSFLHKTLSLKDTTQMAFAIVKALGGGLNTGGSGQLYRPEDSDSAHRLGTAADIGTGGPNPTAASLELFAKAKKMLGTIFAEVIHNGVGLEAGGGTFADSNHYDHVHLEFLKGLGFSLHSGKIGKPPITDIPGASDTIDQALNAAAAKYKVELALVAAVAKQESGFRAQIGSPAGAQGLMQLMPATARSLGVRDVNDPFQNAMGGTKYLKQLLQRFGGRYDLAMAGYNAGPNAPGLSEGRIPPYAETRNYVRMVTSYLEQFRKMFGGFREMGGDVRPGKAYVVGEKRPEIFVPKTAGTILPDANATLSSGKQMIYQDSRTINVTTAASDPQAVADYIDARTRTRLTGVNFR